MEKKYLPNLLSLMRIPLSVVLFFFFEQKNIFLCLYLLLGVTDFLDGYLAKKWKVETTLGARLDSIGDFFFFVALLSYLIGMQWVFVSGYMTFIVIAFSSRIINILLGFIKFGRLIMLHTIANKIAGLLTFLTPALLLLGCNDFIPLVIVSVLVAPFEEFLILLFTRRGDINPNVKSVFSYYCRTDQ